MEPMEPIEKDKNYVRKGYSKEEFEKECSYRNGYVHGFNECLKKVSCFYETLLEKNCLNTQWKSQFQDGEKTLKYPPQNSSIVKNDWIEEDENRLKY